jgi:hypothetical protein
MGGIVSWVPNFESIIINNVKLNPIETTLIPAYSGMMRYFLTTNPALESLP